MTKNSSKVEQVPWIWDQRPLVDTDIPSYAIGYIYYIWHNESGKLYIGKKLMNSTRRSKIGVRAKKATKTRKTYQTIVKDSGWMQYWGSCIELKEDIKKCGEKAFTRAIVEWCWSKKQLSYREVVHQVQMNVLETDTYNGNILNRWFRKDLVRPIKTEV